MPDILDIENDWELVSDLFSLILDRCQTFEKWGFETWYELESGKIPIVYVRGTSRPL